jgi:hypothetical protein
MKPTAPWITYRTRFLVKSKQLTSSLTFTDLLGRQHSGRKGDYLVESNDGVLSIAPRQIFEDIYVPLQAAQEETSQQLTAIHETRRQNVTQRSGEIPAPLLPHLARKSPQPYRDRRNPSQSFRSL